MVRKKYLELVSLSGLSLIDPTFFFQDYQKHPSQKPAAHILLFVQQACSGCWPGPVWIHCMLSLGKKGTLMSSWPNMSFLGILICGCLSCPQSCSVLGPQKAGDYGVFFHDCGYLSSPPSWSAVFAMTLAWGRAVWIFEVHVPDSVLQRQSLEVQGKGHWRAKEAGHGWERFLFSYCFHWAPLYSRLNGLKTFLSKWPGA